MCTLLFQENVSESKNCLALLSTPTLRLWTLIMDFSWLAICFLYPTLSFYFVSVLFN